MKAKAILAILCTVLFAAEWTALSRCSEPVSTTVSCKGMADAAGSHCPKHSKTDSNHAPDCCLSCPMCFQTILPAGYSIEIPNLVAEREYARFIPSYVYLHSPECWNPPRLA